MPFPRSGRVLDRAPSTEPLLEILKGRLPMSGFGDVCQNRLSSESDRTRAKALWAALTSCGPFSIGSAARTSRTTSGNESLADRPNPAARTSAAATASADAARPTRRLEVLTSRNTGSRADSPSAWKRRAQSAASSFSKAPGPHTGIAKVLRKNGAHATWLQVCG